MPWQNKLFLYFAQLGPLQRKGTRRLVTRSLVSFASLALYTLHFSAECGAEASVRKQTENARSLKVGLAGYLTHHFSSIMPSSLVLSVVIKCCCQEVSKIHLHEVKLFPRQGLKVDSRRMYAQTWKL